MKNLDEYIAAFIALFIILISVQPVQATNIDSDRVTANPSRSPQIERPLYGVERSSPRSGGIAPQQVSERGTFDPESCWQDNGGKIIVRLISGLAFAFEPQFFSIRVSWDPVTGPDLPPEGCPGNPLVARSIGFPNWPDWPVSEAALEKKTLPLERFAIYGHGGPIRIQKSDQRIFDWTKRRHGQCEVLSGVLEVCRVCDPASDAPRRCVNYRSLRKPPGTVDYSRVPASYRALAGAYFEHDGLPFAGYCRRPNFSDTPRWCEFRYAIQDGLVVKYKINDWKVPETEFIAFDRKIRKRVLAARAPQFDATPEEMERFQ